MNPEKEYKKLYGKIPRQSLERLQKFLQENKLPKGAIDKFYSEVKRINEIKWKKESLIMYILPKGTPRPRSTSRGSFFYVKGAKDNKRFFANAVSDMNLPLIITPCKIEVISYMPIPHSMPIVDQLLAEHGLIRPISCPDFDNLIKTYADMVKGVLLSDDSIVVDGRSIKYYSWKPRVEFTVEYMETCDSKFNQNKIEKRK